MKNIPKMLSIIKGASLAKRKNVSFTFSRKGGYILHRLLEKNYIASYAMSFAGDKGRVWCVSLKYDNSGRSFIKTLKCFSKPGRRFILKKTAIDTLPTQSDFLFIGPDGAFWLDDMKKLKRGAELFS